MVLKIVTTVATSLYIYFQALCQVLASDCKKVQKLWHAVQKQILSAWRKTSSKITRSSFWSAFFDSILHAITFQASVQSFLIWVVEVPRKNSFLSAVLFFFCSVLSGLDDCYYCSNIIVSLLFKLCAKFSLRLQKGQKLVHAVQKQIMSAWPNKSE